MARLRDVRGRRVPGGYVKYLTREDREEPGGAAAGIKEKDYIMKLNRHIFKSCLLFTVTSLSIAAAFAQRPNDNPGEGDRAPNAAPQTGGARSETLLDLYRGEDGAVEITKIPSKRRTKIKTGGSTPRKSGRSLKRLAADAAGGFPTAVGPTCPEAAKERAAAGRRFPPLAP